jgi:hypothetical protein
VVVDALLIAGFFSSFERRLLGRGAALGCGGRLDFEIGDQQEVYDVERLIRLIHKDRAAGRSEGEEFAMRDRDFATIGEVDEKRPEGLCLIKVA